MTTGEKTVAFVIGAHAFEVQPTLDMLASLEGTTVYPQDLASFVRDVEAERADYDAVVFYNFHGNGNEVHLTDELSESATQALMDLGRDGVGILVLHHGLVAFPESEEWEALRGVEGTNFEGAYHDERIQVEIADDTHPITAGLDTFELLDETYTMEEPDAESRILLRTDHEPSMDALAWTRTYRNSRVFCYQSGHGREAFEHPQFRTILARGIDWVAS